MTEVELKAALTAAQAADLGAELARLGFMAEKTMEETDLYFNGEGERDFRKTDEALRLRRCKALPTGACLTLLTYKGPKLDSRSSARTEYETEVGDLDTAERILHALGFHALYTVKKQRTELRSGAVTACLDQVDGLGAYLELETLLSDGEARESAVERLLRLLDALAVSREALTRASYLELLIASAMEKKSS